MAPLTSPVRVLEKHALPSGRSPAGVSASSTLCDELPILRSQYVARDVRVLIGTRWKLSKFETKTVVLHTNGSSSDASSLRDEPSAWPVLKIGSNVPAEATDRGDTQQFPLPLDLACVGRSSSNELKLKSTSGDAFRVKIRFATAADAGIWRKVLQDALAHARWALDVEHVACLSRDAASSVLLARHAPSKREFVIKVLPHVRVDDMGNTEILVLKKLFATRALAHVRKYRVVETPQDTRVVMPKFPGQNLLQFLHQPALQSASRPHTLSEADARVVMRQLCDALPGGASGGDRRRTRGAQLRPPPAAQRRMVGTPGYIAPERILFVDEPPTPAADVFSAGVVLFQLLTGRQPFVRPSRRRALRIQDTATLHWPAAEQILAQQGVSAAATALLERMVEADPMARIPLEQIRRHPWLA
ncbi:hypothetical protein PybrP1_012501 [[Pythium] brassicae (nom. inval.)]|nr:hypothetical protein PybrP1_012501 [[Pythium] brassicae (nom. inval.)]